MELRSTDAQLRCESLAFGRMHLQSTDTQCGCATVGVQGFS